MGRHPQLLVLVSALIWICPAGIAAAAQESASDNPLLGIWVLDPTQSKFADENANRGDIRTFSLGPDGTLICTMNAVTAKGHHFFVFWQLALGGPAVNVYQRDQGSKPTRTITMKRLDSHTTNMIAMFPKGTPVKDPSVPAMTGIFAVSKDGKTFTYSTVATSPEGRTKTETRIYRRQP